MPQLWKNEDDLPISVFLGELPWDFFFSRSSRSNGHTTQHRVSLGATPGPGVAIVGEKNPWLKVEKPGSDERRVHISFPGGLVLGGGFKCFFSSLPGEMIQFD